MPFKFAVPARLPLAARLAVVAGLAGGLLLVAGGPAAAHPLGNFTINQYSRLRLEQRRGLFRAGLGVASLSRVLPLATASVLVLVGLFLAAHGVTGI